VNVDTLALWAGRSGYGNEPLRTREAYDKCVAAMQHDDYVDVHATTWTPASFVEVLRTLFQLDLVPFRIASFQPTPFNSLEFYVTLERLGDDVPVDERRRLQLNSVPEFAEDQPLASTRAAEAHADVADGRVLLDVSDREARLLETKRRLLGVSRAAARRVRRAARPRPPQG
jgi:hypothetical protein